MSCKAFQKEASQVCPLIDCSHGRLGAAGYEIPENTQTHQIHRKHTSVKSLEENKGSE